jgi:hypothetical protein
MTHRDDIRIVCKNQISHPIQRAEAVAQSQREKLISAFLDAGEALAHYLADSENRVETAWGFRGLIETVALGGDGAHKRSLDAGLYVSDYRRGVKAAIASQIDLV